MDKVKNEVGTLLNKLLADEYVLYTKTRNAHWNVTGSNFYELHKFFEIQHDVLDVMIDDIAERIRATGHFALGSLRDFLRVTQVSEENSDFGNSTQIIQTLIIDHETILHIIRNDIIPNSEKIKDYGTIDFVLGIIEQHEKMLWMLRAFLSEPFFSAIDHIRNISDQFAERQN